MNAVLNNLFFIIAFSYPISYLLNAVSKVTSSTLPFTMQHLCYLWGTISSQWSPNASWPLPREVEGIPTDRMFPKDMPLLTYLAYLPSKEY